MHLLLFVVGFLVSHLCKASDLNSKSVDSKICVIPEYRTTHTNSAYSYKFIKRFLGLDTKCTHIYGDLHILELTPNADGTDPDLSFLESIVEINGRLVIHGNSIRLIPLTNLKVIRGQNTKAKTSVEIFLNAAQDNSSAFHVDLRNLRAVMNGNIYLSENQGYLENRIDWNQILDDPVAHKVEIVKLSHSYNQTYPCHEDCEYWKSSSGNYTQFCFGPLKSQCQPKTKCETTKMVKWCRFTKDGEIPCNYECAGGCHGDKPTECAACNNYFKNSTCSPTCALKTNIIYGKDQSKNSVDKHIYTVGGFCSDHCPDGLLDQDKMCIYECNFNKYYKSGNRCIECLNGNCATASMKDNVICDLTKMDPDYPKNERKYILNKEILQKLTNCTTVLGSVHIDDESFLHENVSVPLLYKHLKNVREIFGELSVTSLLTPIKNLTFIQNLEEIRRSVKQTNQQYSLSIHGKNLEFLGLKKLKYVYGSVIIYGDKNLCYVNTIPWQDISFYPRILSVCNKSCDPLCTRGCWGPGNKFCYSCPYLKAGDYCVKRCSDAPGYYSSYPPLNNTILNQTQCRKCHPLCKQNCTGPTARDCRNQCLHAIEDGACVKKCSLDYYPLKQNGSDHTICRKCHKLCYVDKNSDNFTCTGPSDIFGEGGCSKCKKIIKTGPNTTRCHDGPCPPSYVKVLIPDKQNHDSIILEHSSCEPCHHLCKNCTDLGNHRRACSICNGYFYNDRCISTCPKEGKNYTFKIELGSDCPRCHQQCKNGCLKPNDSSSCLECVNKKLVHNTEDNKFSCVTQCPPHRNYTEFHNGQLFCLTLAETSHSRQKRIILHILIGCISVFVVVFVLFVLYFKRRSNQAKMAAECKALYSNYNEPNMKNMKEDHITRPPNTRRLQMIPVSDLIFDTSAKPLGSGAFGKVYRGYWKVPNFENKTHNLDVVIKVIYNTSKASTDEFLEEAKIMASVAHRHCLPLIGVCLSLEKPCLVSTYAEHGSLDKYLHQYSKKISSYSMLQWAEQIADGMAYLSLRGIIHRDLAARNVLVNSKNIIQITDFGLARLIGDSEESIVVKSGRVPIRWLALETLLNATYSSATDVWAYGVTLWEIFTYGKRPYEDLESNEITTYLLQGNRLCQPEISTLDVYMVMIKCWLHDQHMRPSFKELMITFQQYSQSPRRFLYLPQEHVNKPFSKNNSIMKMHQIAVDSEIRPPSAMNKSDEISWGTSLHNDSAYHLVSNSYSKEQNGDKSFLPRRKKAKRNISLDKIRSFSKFDLTKLITSRLQRESKSFNYKPSVSYDGNKTTCTSIDSMIPLFSTRSCEYDGQQPINPQIAKIKKEIMKCCPNNHVSEGSYKIGNQSPISERIFLDKENKCSLEMKPIIQKPGSKSSNLPPIDIPQFLSQSSSITEPTTISIDNQNKNSPDSGNSHNFDMARDSDDYLIPSHISSAGYYNLTPSPNSIIKHSSNLAESPLMEHGQNYDDGYLEPKKN